MMAAKVTPMAASRASVASAGRTPRQACAVTTNVTVDAMMKPAAQRAAPAPRAVKVGPNEPCPCGSGKKYKKCCGA